MRVVHVPQSPFRSAAPQVVAALRELGVDARAYDFRSEPEAENDHTALEFVRLYGRTRVTPALAIARFAGIVARADVVHWYRARPGFLPRNADQRVLKAFRKRGIVEWRGSDIRSMSAELADNPVFAEVAASAPQEIGRWADDDRSRNRQLAFAELGFHTVVPPGMRQYVLPELLERTHIVQRAIDVAGLRPGMAPEGRRLRIAHAPSLARIKGSDMVAKAIESLSADFDFDYDLIENVSHDVALDRMAACDVFIDQMVLGDYGVAAIEAMALGKPVVCYLKSSVQALYPDDLPIVPARADDLVDVLAGLAVDAERRAELGAQGRAYAEREHDLMPRARALKAVYEAL